MGFDENIGMLDLMIHPAFCVKDGVVVRTNEAAERCMIATGTEIGSLLHIGGDEYREFTDGCLCLTLRIHDQPRTAAVVKMDGQDVFILDQDSEQSELQAMALAARELREPLSSIMTVADQLFPLVDDTEDPYIRKQIAQINRGLFQMLRVIGNMSDAARYSAPSIHMEARDVSAVVSEIFAQAGEMIRTGGHELTFTGLSESIYTDVDADKLERAILNILSNAVKFSPKGGRIHASLTRKGRRLYLSVQDSGEGIASGVRGNVFSRYLRLPGLEDGRFGIGLGMVLIRSAAAVHGGTVLIDQPEGCGTRVTMTMEIRQNKDGAVRSPMLRVDYAGERDHRLVELSDILPAAHYEKQDIN